MQQRQGREAQQQQLRGAPAAAVRGCAECDLQQRHRQPQSSRIGRRRARPTSQQPSNPPAPTCAASPGTHTSRSTHSSTHLRRQPLAVHAGRGRQVVDGLKLLQSRPLLPRVLRSVAAAVQAVRRLGERHSRDAQGAWALIDPQTLRKSTVQKRCCCSACSLNCMQPGHSMQAQCTQQPMASKRRLRRRHEHCAPSAAHSAPVCRTLWLTAAASTSFPRRSWLSAARQPPRPSAPRPKLSAAQRSEGAPPASRTPPSPSAASEPSPRWLLLAAMLAAWPPLAAGTGTVMSGGTAGGEGRGAGRWRRAAAERRRGCQRPAGRAMRGLWWLDKRS